MNEIFVLPDYIVVTRKKEIESASEKIIKNTEKYIEINKQWLHEFLSRRRFYCHVFFTYTYLHRTHILSRSLVYYIEKHDKDFYSTMSLIRIDILFFSLILPNFPYYTPSTGQFPSPASSPFGVALLQYRIYWVQVVQAKKNFIRNNQSGGFNCLHLLHV